MSEKNTNPVLIIVVALIAGAVSFALSFSASSFGLRTGDMTLTYAVIGLSAAVFVVAIWWALRKNRRVPVASEAERQVVLTIGPGPDRGRLIIYREGFVGKMAGVDILVDGAVVAQLKSPRFVALDLPPGPHNVAAAVQGKETDPVAITLAPGAVVAVKVAMILGGVKATRDDDLAALFARLPSIPMVRSDGPAPALA